MRHWIPIIVLFIIGWISMFTIDYYRVFNMYEKPLFAMLTNIPEAKKGHYLYQGLGYNIEFEGNFRSKTAKDYGVRKAEIYILDKEFKSFRK